MVIVSYDIESNKKRASFYKYLKKYGHRLQFSVFQIDNSDRVLNNIIHDIINKFKKEFDENDSIYIFKINDNNITRFGHAQNEIKNVIIVS